MKKMIKTTGICILMTAATMMCAEGEQKQRKKMKISDLPPIPHAPQGPMKQGNILAQFLNSQPEILAKYGEFEVTQATVVKAFTNSVQMQRIKMSSAQLKIMLTQQVTSKIERTILLYKTINSGITPSIERASLELEKMASQYGGMEKFKKLIQMQGINPVIFEKELGENLAIREYIENQKKAIKIADSAIEVHYNNNKAKYTAPNAQIRASHIMVALKPNLTAEQRTEAKKKITAILAQIKQGKDFEELAKKNSDCPSGKRSGGDIRFFPQNSPRMDPAFSKAAWSLKNGEVSEVIQSRFGYHIIKMTGQRKAGLATLLQVKDIIVQELQQKEMKNKVKSMIADELKTGRLKYFIK